MKQQYLLRVILFGTLFLTLSCGSKKQTQRDSVQSEIEEKLANYKSAGWQIQGSSRTMRGLLSMVIERLNENPDLTEISGSANNFSVISNGKEAASANASNRYAAAATKLVRGEVDNDSKLLQAIGEERDFFYAKYSSSIERLIRGELKEVYTLIRYRQDGKMDCEIHYLVDETKAAANRQTAMNQTLKEMKLDQEAANLIREGINQTPNIE